MLTRETINKTAMRLHDYCGYPAVRYNILFHFLDTPYENSNLAELCPEFLNCDIVEEL